MQRLYLTTLLLVLLVSFAKAQQMPGDDEVKKEVMKLEQDMVPILLKGGSQAADWWERYNDDDIAYVGADGHMLTKAQIVAEWRSGVRKSSSVIHDNYRVHVYGDTAVVTYNGKETGKETGRNHQKRNEANRTTEVWVKQNGAWQRVVHHVTALKEE